MRLQCAKACPRGGGAKQSSGLGVKPICIRAQIFNPHGIDAIGATIKALPPSQGLARASLQLSSAGYCTFDVLPGRNCGNKAQLVFDFDQIGRKKAVAPA